MFEGIQKAIVRDRYAFFTDFFKNFYNTDLLLGKRVSQEAVQASWNVAAGASATASLACVPTWHEDFRKDLTRIDVPTLVIHGDADRILPINASGLRTAKMDSEAEVLCGSVPLDATEKLDRHEAHLERHLYRAMAKLDRLQMRRRGENGPPEVRVHLTRED